MSHSLSGQTLFITEKLYSLNEYRNAHYHKLNSLKLHWLDITKMALIRYKIKPVSNPVEIYFTFQFVNNRRKDLDNYSATVKFILDALVYCEIIPDDSIKFIKSIKLAYQIGDIEGVKVEIVEVSGDWIKCTD